MFASGKNAFAHVAGEYPSLFPVSGAALFVPDRSVKTTERAKVGLQANSSMELWERLIKCGSKNVFLGRLCHPPLMGVFNC